MDFRKWNPLARQDDGEPVAAGAGHDIAHRLFTIRAYPIRYLVIPKCGCTFVKNLLWRLEHGTPHADQLRIHDADEGFLRASALGLSREAILAEEHAFTIVRNPVDRFFSLYADKVIGEGHRNFVPLRKVLQESHGLDVEAQTPAEHSRNCEILADWLERNLREKIDLKPESHWTPQSYRYNVMAHFNLKILVLPDLERQLGLLLGDLVPDLDAVMAEIDQNRTRGRLVKGEILTPEIRKKVNAVYARDREFFVLARDRWQALAGPGATGRRICRFRDLLPDHARG